MTQSPQPLGPHCASSKLTFSHPQSHRQVRASRHLRRFLCRGLVPSSVGCPSPHVASKAVGLRCWASTVGRCFLPRAVSGSGGWTGFGASVANASQGTKSCRLYIPPAEKLTTCKTVLPQWVLIQVLPAQKDGSHLTQAGCQHSQWLFCWFKQKRFHTSRIRALRRLSEPQSPRVLKIPQPAHTSVTAHLTEHKSKNRGTGRQRSLRVPRASFTNIQNIQRPWSRCSSSWWMDRLKLNTAHCSFS